MLFFQTLSKVTMVLKSPFKLEYMITTLRGMDSKMLRRGKLNNCFNLLFRASQTILN